MDAHLGERLREGGYDCVLQVPGPNFLLHQTPQAAGRTHARCSGTKHGTHCLTCSLLAPAVTVALSDSAILCACRKPRLHRQAHRAAHPIHAPPAASANRHHRAQTVASAGQRPPAPCEGYCNARQWAMCAAAMSRYACVWPRARGGRRRPAAFGGVRGRAAACGGKGARGTCDARALHTRCLSPLNWWYRGVKGPGSDHSQVAGRV